MSLSNIVQGTDNTNTGSITALNDTVELNTQGCSSVVFNITGTWVASLSPEGTVDGTNWVLVTCSDQAQNISAVITSNQRAYINCGGFLKIRLKASAFTSGTITIDGDASTGNPQVVQVWNTNASSFKVQARLQDSNGVAVTVGQKAMASSLPIVISSDQTAIPVSGTVIVDTSLLATSAKQDAQTTALGTLLTTTDFDTKTGSLTETAPATDTASSGLNGRLQRIAQRITSLITALGSPFQAGGSIGNTAFIANAGTNLNTSALNLEATQALIKAKTDNLDVALSTRNLEATQLLIKAKTDNLDVALSTRLKPADTLAGVTTVATVTTITNPVKIERANLLQSVTGTSGSAVTATLPLVASQFHNITFIEIVAYTTLARVGSATPIVVTTTNLNSLAFTFATAGAVGTTDRITNTQGFSIQSAVVGTASTIVCPATTSVIWRINVYYNTST